MSLYNMIHGVTPATFYVLPMLGKHPDEYPRFRDCFLYDEEHPEFDKHIFIYTRTGGLNRSDYAKENGMIATMDGFVTTYDNSFDNTFAYWVFRVPDRWQPDFDRFLSGNIRSFSPEYQAELRRIYPKLVDKWNELFGPSNQADQADQAGQMKQAL